MPYSGCSDMEFRCDLYVRAGDSGPIAVYVRTHRRAWEPPETWDALMRGAGGTPDPGWIARRNAWYAALAAAPAEPVDHPMAGTCVRGLAPAAALWLCERLVASGLRAPEALLPALRAAAGAERAAEPRKGNDA